MIWNHEYAWMSDSETPKIKQQKKLRPKEENFKKINLITTHHQQNSTKY